MEYLILLLVIFLIYLFIKSNRRKSHINPNYDSPRSEIEIPNIEVKVSTGYNNINDFNYPPIKRFKENDWVINPSSSFELTLQNINQNVAQEVRSLLGDNELYGYRKVDRLVELFSQNNIIVKEIEDYKDKYKLKYFSKIEELENTSIEWKKSYAADKVDLLEEFREQALEEIYERPNVDLIKLFELEPKDITIDNELIKEYGFENLRTYLKFYDKPDKIRTFPKDHYLRSKFDELEKLNLAERGYNLPQKDILETLTLKELNKIAQHPEKEFKRKRQAIEYILTGPNLNELIGKNISMRELFKLRPLPEKYLHINLSEIANSWSYTYVVVELFENTYRNAYYFDRNKKEDKDYIKGYKINYRRNEIHCNCCKEHSEKTYTKNNLPNYPLHIGCSCFIETIYDFD